MRNAETNSDPNPKQKKFVRVVCVDTYIESIQMVTKLPGVGGGGWPRLEIRADSLKWISVQTKGSDPSCTR